MRVNLGCGGQVVDGWVNLDRAGDAPIEIHDLRDPLPFADQSVDGAVAHHVLDLLDEADVRALLADVYRILVPGGVLRISIASLVKGLDAVIAEDLEWFTSRGAPDGDLVDAYMWWMTCGGARKTIMAVPSIISALLVDAGFKCDVVSFHETIGSAWLCDLDSREDESFFVDAVKP